MFYNIYSSILKKYIKSSSFFTCNPAWRSRLSRYFRSSSAVPRPRKLRNMADQSCSSSENDGEGEDEVDEEEDSEKTELEAVALAEGELLEADEDEVEVEEEAELPLSRRST